ncbi:MAG: energy transducer TonB [Verrucomicrobiales bacterium]|nr:energy transducer TonB [Verrucomicrobiales bacterium]
MSFGSYRRGDDDPLIHRLAGALVVSILLHTTFFAVVQIGHQLKWWEARPFAVFSKVRITPEEAVRLQERMRQAEQQREAEEPMMFVQVTQPSDEPPPNSAFYSSQNSRAANPEPGTLERPKFDGRQTQSIRTETAPPVPTARATPPPPPEPVGKEVTPEPVRSAPPVVDPVVAPPPPKLTAPQPEPQRPAGVGELAMVRPLPPAPKVVPAPNPQPAAPNPNPVTAPPGTPTPPPRARPRTVTEAKLRQNLLAGEQMKQDGGVARRGVGSLDVKGTGFGAYDEALVMAVQNRWFALLEERRFAGGATGRVVVKFRLQSDGTVRIVEPVESSVDALLESICVRAVRDPAPYEKWPPDMMRMVGSNSREVRFTFYYN